MIRRGCQCVTLSFDQQDAEVVCRDWTVGLPVQVLGADAF